MHVLNRVKDRLERTKHPKYKKAAVTRSFFKKH